MVVTREDPGQGRDSGEAVHHAVVDPQHDRLAAVLEPAGESELPEGVAAVERALGQRGAQAVELGWPAGRG